MAEKYPPTKTRLRELLAKERRLDSLEYGKMITPFVECAKENLFIMLLDVPYGKWPSLAKKAFEVAMAKHPTPAGLYLERLPKEEKTKEETFSCPKCTGVKFRVGKRGTIVCESRCGWSGKLND